VLSTSPRTTSSSRVVPGPSSKPLRRQLTWGDGGISGEQTTIPERVFGRSITEPQQPPDKNPFLVPVAESGDGFFTSASRTPPSDPPISSVRPTVAAVLERTDVSHYLLFRSETLPPQAPGASLKASTSLRTLNLFRVRWTSWASAGEYNMNSRGGRHVDGGSGPMYLRKS